MADRRWLRLRLVIAAAGAMLLLAQGPAAALAVDGSDGDRSEPGSAQAISLAPARASMLGSGESLSAGDHLTSPNGRYRMELRLNGNLVLIDTSPPAHHAVLSRDDWPLALGRPDPVPLPLAIWESGTDGVTSASLMMLPDGNLVLAEAHPEALMPVWQTRSSGLGSAHLHVSDDGNLMVRADDGRVLWLAGASTPDVGLDGTAHIVYQRAAQRVWLIEADGSVFDNYMVSGKATSPKTGRFHVYSKSAVTRSVDGRVMMQHMVRFSHGPNGIPIGFHSIPRWLSGEPMQTVAQLGQFLSGGCVRQHDRKAQQLYEWTPVGTPVVVTDAA